MDKVNPVGSNQTEIEKENGITILYSYREPVAVFVPGVGAVCTTQKFSKTTSKHVGLAIKRWGCTRVDVSPSDFAQAVRS